MRMNENLKQAVEILVSNYYLTSIDGQLVITNKFERELAQIKPEDLFKSPEVPSELPKVTRELLKVNPKTKQVVLSAGQQSPLVKFIMDCEVPTKVKGGDGKFYYASKYSKDAEKELQVILNNGHQYDILVSATRLYYKAGGMVEAISNYICRGTWLTHYLEMEKALRGGTAEKHIKTNLADTAQRKDMYDDR